MLRRHKSLCQALLVWSTGLRELHALTQAAHSCAFLVYTISEQIGVLRDHNHILSLFHMYIIAVPPTITSHPQEIEDAVPGKPVVFTIQATGTDPLSYKWQWKPAEGEGGSEEWQPCDAESTSLTIPSVHESNEGSYRCVVSNIAGTQTSKPAKLSIGKSPCMCI